MFLCSTQYNQSCGERPMILKPDFKNANAALEIKIPVKFISVL